MSHAAIALHVFIGIGLAYVTAMYRRDVLLNAGGYDPSVPAAEDVELVLRLVQQTQLANLPDNLYLYRMHIENKSYNRTPEWKELAWDERRRAVRKLWGEAPEATMRRFSGLRRGYKFSWNQRRLARQDIKRLIDAMIDANWVVSADRDTLLAEMNRKLEQTMRRRWQQFLHWRRHRFPNL